MEWTKKVFAMGVSREPKRVGSSRDHIEKTKQARGLNTVCSKKLSPRIVHEAWSCMAGCSISTIYSVPKLYAYRAYCELFRFK